MKQMYLLKNQIDSDDCMEVKMSEKEKKGTEPWFWLVGIVAVMWNLMGVVAYLMQAYMSPETLAAMEEAQRTLYENQPAWVTGAFALGVFSGLAASILLLLRKRLAFQLFVISLISVLAQMTYVFFLSNSMQVMGGPRAAIMPFMIMLLAVFFVWFSHKVKKMGVIA